MSELKTYFLGKNNGREFPVYLKSEADKVIAELEESHKKEVEQLILTIEQCKRAARTLRKKMEHSNYKRCLAMAEWCESEEKRLEAISPIFDADKECWEYNSDYWARWHERWLELAEKFKEGVQCRG